MTARQAVQELKGADLVASEHGRGVSARPTDAVRRRWVTAETAPFAGELWRNKHNTTESALHAAHAQSRSDVRTHRAWQRTRPDTQQSLPMNGKPRTGPTPDRLDEVVERLEQRRQQALGEVTKPMDEDDAA